MGELVRSREGELGQGSGRGRERAVVRQDESDAPGRHVLDRANAEPLGVADMRGRDERHAEPGPNELNAVGRRALARRAPRSLPRLAPGTCGLRLLLAAVLVTLSLGAGHRQLANDHPVG